jgi:hypothetical protein
MSFGPSATRLEFQPESGGQRALEGHRCPACSRRVSVCGRSAATKFTTMPRGSPSRSPMPGHQDLLEVGARQALAAIRGEVLDDDDRFGAGILELVLELAGGVQRIDVLTTTIPARSTPNSAMGYCRMFGIITATRSPAPARISSAATRRMPGSIHRAARRSGSRPCWCTPIRLPYAARLPRTYPRSEAYSSGSMSVGTGRIAASAKFDPRKLTPHFCPACIAPVQVASNVFGRRSMLVPVGPRQSAPVHSDSTGNCGGHMRTSRLWILALAGLGLCAVVTGCLFLAAGQAYVDRPRPFPLLSRRRWYRQCAHSGPRPHGLSVFAGA